MGIPRNRPTLEHYQGGAKFWGDLKKCPKGSPMGVLQGIEDRKTISKSLDQSDRFKVAIQR